jgi:hypothetical protein
MDAKLNSKRHKACKKKYADMTPKNLSHKFNLHFHQQMPHLTLISNPSKKRQKLDGKKLAGLELLNTVTTNGKSTKFLHFMLLTFVRTFFHTHT